ncbi:MAG: carboxypeptidase-like regulatory domain-containing protein [Planctomycetaceae bacterium]
MARSKFTTVKAVLPCVAIAIAASATAAEQTRLSQPAVSDVVLQADGTLVGRLIDAEGRAIDGAAVTLSKNQDVVAHTTTDAEGAYRIALDRGGVYRVTAGRTSRDFRVWPAQTAPPGAQTYATLVEAKGVVRGQLGGVGVGTALGIAGGVVGVTLGAVSLDEANNAEDEVAELRAILDALSP